MKKTEKKIENYYKNSYMIITTIALYLSITILKDIFYSLFNISLNDLNNNLKMITNTTYQLFAISISVLFLIKNKDKTLNEFKQYLKIAGIGILTIFVYSITSLLEVAILYYGKVNVQAMSVLSKTIYLISCESLIMAVIALINNKDLEKNIKDISKNYKKYIKKYFKYYLLALLIMMLSNFIINIINPGIAGNEQEIRNTLQKAPIYMFFSAVIFAPFTEEMVFRKAIRNIIKNDTIFIITSGLIFGGLHVIGNINTITDLLYIIPYSTPGIIFAYILTKTDNIFVPIGFHFLHNGLLITLQILTTMI